VLNRFSFLPGNSYGANTFKLHRLPAPRAGQVLGLVGTNGIGKSTALKVVRNLSPNPNPNPNPFGKSTALKVVRNLTPNPNPFGKSTALKVVR
jgi:translation initiation factor RLI1